MTTNQKSPDAQIEKPEGNLLRRSDFGTLWRAIAIVSAGVPVTGFLTLNGHLSNFGLYDFSIVNSHLISAGTLFTIFISLWFVVVGYPLITRDTDYKGEIEIARELGRGSIWIRIVKLTFYFRLGFITCVPCILFTSIFEGRPITLLNYWIFVPAIFFYIWNRLGDSQNRLKESISYYRIAYIVQLIVFIVGTYLFAIALAFEPIFYSYFLCTLWLILLISFLHWYGESPLLHNVVVIIAVVCASSGMFGKLIYGDISNAFGGGQLLPAEVIITSDVVKKGLKDMGVQTSPYLQAKLIYENQRGSIFYVNGHTIRLSNDSVGGIRVSPTDIEIGAQTNALFNTEKNSSNTSSTYSFP